MSDAAPPGDAPLVQAMLHLLDGKSGEQITIGEFVAHMGQRGFGFCLIVFGILAAISLPGVGSLMGAPLILFSAQLLVGFKQPWLPQRLARRTFSADSAKRTLERARGWLKRIEIFARPGAPFLARGMMERVVALVCLLLAAVILMPGPLTNNPPGLATTILGFALAERDGVLVLIGLLAAVVAFVVGLSAFIAVAVAIWAWAQGWL